MAARPITRVRSQHDMTGKLPVRGQGPYPNGATVLPTCTGRNQQSIMELDAEGTNPVKQKPR